METLTFKLEGEEETKEEETSTGTDSEGTEEAVEDKENRDISTDEEEKTE